eukprot:CAMPEP_0195127666 /NCGR_PEP_ID=MMETSP0448-20130528/137495_1 /TAXON_ID=66468 /ORGANISM="Heterocapsa triquestra, Strain CCMP 448" /LENGTH=36 /DNA_ID= /DNA_START= /DNA_END= /DNA_ORIENTATION=
MSMSNTTSSAIPPTTPLAWPGSSAGGQTWPGLYAGG